MSFLDRQGFKLHYIDWGSGRPIVFLHGWPLSSASWEYQMVPLAAQGFRCLAYDRRGFGHSEKPYSGYDYDTLAGDLKGFLDGLDLQDVTLVGFSMGGGEVARYMSLFNGARVTRVAFVSAVTPFLLKTGTNPDGVDRSVFDQMVEGVHKDRPHFLATFGKTFFGAGLLNFSVSDDLLDWAKNLALQASPKATIDCIRAFSETDFRGDLPRIRVPTLVIHGDADETVPLNISGELTAKLVPGAKLNVYKGAPHGLFYTERERLNVDLATFARA